MRNIMFFLIPAALLISSVMVYGQEPEDLSSCKRGWAATESGDYATGIKLFEACIKNGNLSNKSMARTYRNIGIAQKRNGEPRKAIENYDKAIALHPTDVHDDYVNKGNAWSELGDYKKALKEYDLALKSKPDYNEAYYNRGIVFEKQNQLEKAKIEFVKAYENGLRSDQLYDRYVKYGLVNK